MHEPDALGVAPVSDSSSSTHRGATGMKCTTIRYTAKACRLGPYPTGPGAGPLRARRGVHRAAAAAHRMLVVLGDRAPLTCGISCC